MQEGVILHVQGWVLTVIVLGVLGCVSNMGLKINNFGVVLYFNEV